MIDSARFGTRQVIDQLSDGAHRLAAQTDEFAQRGVEALRGSAGQLRERARYAADQTIGRIRDEPMQSVLVAVAVGAALGLLLALLARPRD